MPFKVQEPDRKRHISRCVWGNGNTWESTWFFGTPISDITCLALTGSKARASHLKWRTQLFLSPAGEAV